MPDPTTAAEVLEALRKSRSPHNCRDTQIRRTYPYLKCRSCREEWLDAYARQQVEAFRERVEEVVKSVGGPRDARLTGMIAAAIAALRENV